MIIWRDMVQHLWSSIVARQQATETETAAAKHMVLCSQSTTSLKMNIPSDKSVRKDPRPKTWGQKALHWRSVRHPVIVRCWSKIAKEGGKETKPTNTQQEARQHHKIQLSFWQLYCRNLWLSLNQLGRMSMTVCKWIKCHIKIQSTISNYLWLPLRFSATEKCTAEGNAAQACSNVCIYSWEHI